MTSIRNYIEPKLRQINCIFVLVDEYEPDKPLGVRLSKKAVPVPNAQVYHVDERQLWSKSSPLAKKLQELIPNTFAYIMQERAKMDSAIYSRFGGSFLFPHKHFIPHRRR